MKRIRLYGEWIEQYQLSILMKHFQRRKHIDLVQKIKMNKTWTQTQYGGEIQKKEEEEKKKKQQNKTKRNTTQYNSSNNKL